MTNKFYRKGTNLQVEEYNFPLAKGGLGDLIGHLPAIKYVLDHHPQIKINLWVHDYGMEICNKLFSHYKNLTIFKISDYKKYKNDLDARSPYAHVITNLSSSIVDHGFLTIVGKQPEDPKSKNYLIFDPIDVSSFNLPKKYAVITTGFTSKTREWLPECVYTVSQYLIERGITPVYIGKSYTTSYSIGDQKTGISGTFKSDYSNGINIIDKTTLIEAHGIMSHATMVLGLDNGLLHLAGLTKETPIIAGYTTVEPIHRSIQRHDVDSYKVYTVYPTREELTCIGCQSHMNFARHDFRYCLYDDYKCLELLSAEKWIKQIDKCLKDTKGEVND